MQDADRRTVMAGFAAGESVCVDVSKAMLMPGSSLQIAAPHGEPATWAAGTAQSVQRNGLVVVRLDVAEAGERPLMLLAPPTALRHRPPGGVCT